MKAKRFASRTAAPQIARQRKSSQTEGSAANDSFLSHLGFPTGVRRHPRFISEWANNQVVIDVGHHQALGKTFRTIDLDEIFIAAEGRHGGIYRQTVWLGDFPHFQFALKRVINGALTDFHEGEAGTKVGTIVRMCQHIFSWLLQRAIYKLEDATHDDIRKLLEEVANRSWLRVNGVNRRLIQLGLQIKANPSIAQNYVGKSRGGPLRANWSEIEKAVGLPLSNFAIPNWFRRRLGAIYDPSRKVLHVERSRQAPSYYEVSDTAHALNRLSLAPNGIDSFPFRPFQSPNAAAKALITEDRGQTPNLTPTECIALFAEFFKWVYEYGPRLVAILWGVRQAIENNEEFGSESSINEIIAYRFNILVDAGEMVGARISATAEGAEYFVQMVTVCMAAAGSLVGMNHARRANEIFGKSKPYGAYFGCVEKISDMPRAYEAEFYVEKGPKDWRFFPANVVVADAIKLMEEFYVLFRGIGEPVPDYSSPRSARRSKKLFQVRRLNRRGFRDSSFTPDWRKAFKVLVERAGLDYSRWVDQHAPYRRMYATWFMRRYDMRELPALQQQLGQASAAQALPYAGDNSERPPSLSVEELHPKGSGVDEAAVFKELATANRDYLIDLVKALFDLKRSGGIFPKLIVKLAKRLSAAADFRKLSASRRAEAIVDKAIARGYAITSMRHTICVAGTAKSTRRFAKCARDGELRRELAVPEVCSGCIHSWTNESYHTNMREDAERCTSRAKRPGAPAAYSAAQLKQAQAIKELIDLDQTVSEETRSIVAEFLTQWDQSMEAI